MAKNYAAAIAAASVANGFTANASTPYGLVCEGMLDDVSIAGLRAVEIATTGEHVIFVTTTVGGVVTNFVVCDAMGKERIYRDSLVAIKAATKTNFEANSSKPIELVKATSIKTVGNPIAQLTKTYIQHFKEEETAKSNSTAISEKITAARSLGWNVSVGTPERAEYDLLQVKKTAIDTWKVILAAKIAALATNLTASGVDPATLVTTVAPVAP